MALYLTGDRASDTLLAKDPFALLIGMVLDQQVPLERAFSAPSALRDRLGGSLDVATIAEMEPSKLAAIFSERPALHRFPSSMAGRVQAVAKVVIDEYNGDAAAIWKGAKSGSDLLGRIRKLPGFGEQKAKIFIALLGKRLGVKPTGWAEAAGSFGETGSFHSIADIDSAAALERVREHKKEMKAKAKAAAPKATAARKR